MKIILTEKQLSFISENIINEEGGGSYRGYNVSTGKKKKKRIPGGSIVKAMTDAALKVKNASKPKNSKDIKDFQIFARSKGFKNVAGKRKGALISADGTWGANSQAAWDKLFSVYKKPNTGSSDLDKPKQIGTGGFVIPFAFPEYEPTCDGTSSWDKLLCGVSSFLAGGEKSGTYGKLGHAGVATVTKSGNVQVFEFGRYSGSKKGGGLVKRKDLGRIATVSNGVITNIDSVINKVHRRTEGAGPKEKIEYAVLSAPNIESGISYAKSITNKDYSALDFTLDNDAMNCATYALEVVRASGVHVSSIVGPTPIQMINNMQIFALRQKDPMAYFLKNIVT